MTVSDAEALADRIDRSHFISINEDGPVRYIFSTEEEALVVTALRSLGPLRDALKAIGQYAKTIRNSDKLIGPAEYAHDAKSMKVWQRALYHEGKTIEGMVKAPLHSSELSQPEKPARTPIPVAVSHIELAKKIAEIDALLENEDHHRDSGYIAFVRIRKIWPALKSAALSTAANPSACCFGLAPLTECQCEKERISQVVPVAVSREDVARIYKSEFERATSWGLGGNVAHEVALDGIAAFLSLPLQLHDRAAGVGK